MNNRQNRDFRKRVKARAVISGIALFFLVIFALKAVRLMRDPWGITKRELQISRIVFIGGFLGMLVKTANFISIWRGGHDLPRELQDLLDERQEWIYCKCGGFPLDILLYFHLLVTCMAFLVDKLAHQISLMSLGAILLLKAIAYIVYSRKYYF